MTLSNESNYTPSQSHFYAGQPRPGQPGAPQPVTPQPGTVTFAPPQPSVPTVSTQMGVPDQLVGVVVGKGGMVLKGIMGSTGARIKVSQKGEYISGTTNRSVTIEGTQEQVGPMSYRFHWLGVLSVGAVGISYVFSLPVPQVHYAHTAIMAQLASHQERSF